MHAPDHLLNILNALGFEYQDRNNYTLQPRYCRKIRNITFSETVYYNSAILLETWSHNFMIFRIIGYRSIDDQVIDISRLIYPGVGQFLYYSRLTGARNHLNRYRADAVAKYGL